MKCIADKGFKTDLIIIVSDFPVILLNTGSLPSEFRYGKAPILIATDVASRGLGQYGIDKQHSFISVTLILKKVVLLSLTFLCIFWVFLTLRWSLCGRR